MPRVRAALCSRFILIKCLSFVGVCSCSTSCSVNVFDEPEPLSASPDDDGCVGERKQHDKCGRLSNTFTPPVAVKRALFRLTLTWWLHWWAMHQHGIAMTHHQLLLLTIGLTKDSQVSEYHDGAGYPERYWARYYGIVFIHHKCALLGMFVDEQPVLLRRVPANKNGQEREQCRRYPCV